MCHVLMRAWLALHEHDLVLQHSRRALDDLARALGYRPRPQTYAVLAGVLASYVWPDRFTTWHQAMQQFDSTVTKQSGRNGSKYNRGIQDLLARLGGAVWMRAALTPLLPRSQLARQLAAQRRQ